MEHSLIAQWTHILHREQILQTRPVDCMIAVLQLQTSLLVGDFSLAKGTVRPGHVKVTLRWAKSLLKAHG